MAIPTILKGDATNANGRTVAIHLPDVDLDGFALRFEYLGITREFDGLTRGGTVHADFSESETAMFPLGTHFGTLRLGRAGKWHTVSATVPVKVSDNVGEVYGGDAANINLAIDFCGGIPDLSGIESEPTTANALARAFKALLDALKGAAGTVALLACLAGFGAPRMTVHSAPLGEVAFGSRVVTGVEFDESGLVTGDDIADVVREDYLKSMSWTNANFASAVHSAIPRVVNSINGATGDVNVTANSIGAIPLRDANTEATMGPDGLELTGVGTYGGFIRFGDWTEYELPTVSVQDGNGRGVFVGYSGRVNDYPDVRILYGNYGFNTRPYEISLFDTYERVVALSNALASASGGAWGFTPEMATNVARAVVKPHIDNRNNPHGVTASQVGARPDTWLPSPQEIGAIPQYLNSPYSISLGEFPLFFDVTSGGRVSTEMAVTTNGVWISGLNVAGRLVKGGEDVATEQFILAASNNLARVRLDIVLMTSPTQHYEIQRDGVRQTFDQVAALASNQGCYIKRASGIYHPTYVSAAEVMFDCVGTIQGIVETRRIHMVASTGLVTIGDLKVLADRDWVESLPTTYTNFSASAMVSLNQSVQKIDVSSSARLDVHLPSTSVGQTGDFVVYAVNTTSEGIPLALPAGTWYMPDEAYTNAIGSGVTALYFTEVSHGVWYLGRQELKPVEVK